MSFDYDIFVIDPANLNSSDSQIRDCVKDALERLSGGLQQLDRRLKKMEQDGDGTVQE